MSYNTWIHKISRVMVKPLANTPVTPNQLTTGRLIFGLTAAGCFTVGEFGLNMAGAVCFLISMLLDRADGELARMTGKTSRFGAIYDLVTDAICNVALFIGIGIACMDSQLGIWAFIMGLIAGICISIILYVVVQLATEVNADAAAMQSFAGFDPDDAIAIVPIGVVLGFGKIILILAAICTPIVAIFITRDMIQRRRQATSA
ncbi:MAG: CDP-alcohol phosphatidyltransferase family protein [Pseudomonadota bacterium]